MAENELPAGRAYKGPHGIARDSPWLTSEDLPHDRETEVTIENVIIRQNVTFQGGRKKPIVLSLKFVGKERELGLNATNRKTLAALFGTEDSRNNTANWFGKRIALFVEQDVRRPDGTKGPAVRIRAKRLKQGDAQAEAVAADSSPTTEAPNRDPGADA